MTDQPDIANRLRLAHQARRAKEHQLDDIRRALCDVGVMQDDDPYSHADVADVIRQAWPTETGGAPSDDETAQCPKPGPHAPHMWTWREEGVDCPGIPEPAVAVPATADDGLLHSAISRLKELVEWRTAEVLRLTELTAQYADRAIANGKRAEQAEAAVARVRALAADMRTWCSHHDVAVDYAQRIDDALDGQAGQ